MLILINNQLIIDKNGRGCNKVDGVYISSVWPLFYVAVVGICKNLFQESFKMI